MSRKTRGRRRSYNKTNYRKTGKMTLRNHRHMVKPMSGLTSIPVRFRGRRA